MTGPWMGSVGGVDLSVDANVAAHYRECMEESRRTFTCPNCGEHCWREEADVGIGIIFGPWGCPCGWSESHAYNQLDGPTATAGKRTDQWGMLYPAEDAPPGARDTEVPS
jgi:predicted RNA-binding Zn-ribbon protein involved in translation (DUF1610 family)